jgi:hypothetical protein
MRPIQSSKLSMRGPLFVFCPPRRNGRRHFVARNSSLARPIVEASFPVNPSVSAAAATVGSTKRAL